MVETKGLGAGSYPVPHEIIDDDEYDDFGIDDDYNLHYADEYHELMMIGEL